MKNGFNRFFAPSINSGRGGKKEMSVINLLLTYFIWLVVFEEARRATVEVRAIEAPYETPWTSLLLRFAPVIFYSLEGLHLASEVA